MKELEVLEILEQTKGSNAKLAILRDSLENMEFGQLIDVALNFNKKFYVKKFNVNFNKNANKDLHDQFLSLLDELENRIITGSTAISRVESFFRECNELQAKWYTRVLKKDLRIGVDISTVNKAGYMVPIFDVMLAKDGKETKKLNEIIKKGVWVSPKLDGYRCVAVCSYGIVSLYSRNGTTYENFPSVISELEKMCEESSFVLDGEIMSDDFQSMQQSAFASTRGTTVGDVKYHIFDYLTPEEWDEKNFKLKKSERLAQLDSFLAEYNGDKLVKVPFTHVSDLNQVLELERQFLSEGYEGAMAINDVPYFVGRKTGGLLKFKTMKSQDCRVLGVYEGTGKYVGSLGGIKVLQEDGITECDVGTGFNDLNRKIFWQQPELIVDKLIEVSYQDLTNTSVMRFPVFKRFRSDK